MRLVGGGGLLFELGGVLLVEALLELPGIVRLIYDRRDKKRGNRASARAIAASATRRCRSSKASCHVLHGYRTSKLSPAEGVRWEGSIREWQHNPAS